MNDVTAGRVDDYEKAALDLANQLVAIFAVAVPSIGHDKSVGVEEGSRGVSEIKPTLGKARLAFGFIPLEILNRGIRSTASKRYRAIKIYRNEPMERDVGNHVKASIKLSLWNIFGFWTLMVPYRVIGPKNRSPARAPVQEPVSFRNFVRSAARS